MVKPPWNGLRRKERWNAASRRSSPDFQYAYAIVSWYRSVSSASDGRYSSDGIRTEAKCTPFPCYACAAIGGRRRSRVSARRSAPHKAAKNSWAAPLTR